MCKGTEMRMHAQPGGTESGEWRNGGGERMKCEDAEAGTENARKKKRQVGMAKVKPSRTPCIAKRSEEN